MPFCAQTLLILAAVALMLAVAAGAAAAVALGPADGEGTGERDARRGGAVAEKAQGPPREAPRRGGWRALTGGAAFAKQAQRAVTAAGDGEGPMREEIGRGST